MSSIELAAILFVFRGVGKPYTCGPKNHNRERCGQKSYTRGGVEKTTKIKNRTEDGVDKKPHQGWGGEKYIRRLGVWGAGLKRRRRKDYGQPQKSGWRRSWHYGYGDGEKEANPAKKPEENEFLASRPECVEKFKEIIMDE